MADGRDYFRASIDTSQFDRDAAHIRITFSDIGKTAESEGAIIDNSLKKVGATIAGIFTFQKASEFAREIANVRGEFQQLEIAFETMLGSKAKSDALMSQLIDTAAKTPFDLTGVANGAKQLLAYGTASEKVNETLIRLGDIASGLSIPLNDLVYLYGTSQVQGRLFSKDIYQFMGRGIPIIKELSKELKVSEDSVMELVSAGKVGFPELQKVIENMTNQGGMFYNLMEKQSASITGQIANLEDAYDVMLNDIGKKSEGTFTSAIDIATTLVENYETVGKVIGGLIVTYGTYKAAVIAVNFVQSMQTKIALESALAGRTLTFTQGLQAVATKQLSIAQAFLNKTMLANPYVLATMALVGLGYAIYKLITYQNDAEKAQGRLNDAIKEAEKSSISESRELARLKGELSAATKGTDEYNEIKQKIIKNYGKYYDGLEQEIENVGLLETTYNKLTKAIQKSFGARQYQSFMQSEQENLDNIMSENLGKIQDRLIDKLGEEEGSKYYAKIRNGIISRDLDIDLKRYYLGISGFDSETKAVLDKISGEASNDWIQNHAIEGYIKNIILAQKQTDEMDKKYKLKFGIEDGKKEPDDNTEDDINKVKTLAEQTEEARKAVAKLKQELADLRSGKSESNNYAKDIEAKAKELKAAEDKLSYLTGKGSSSSSGESPAENAHKQALELKKTKEQQALQAIRAAENLEMQINEAELNAMDEGSEKVLAQLELKYQKEKRALKRQQEDALKTKKDNARALFEADASNKGKTFDDTAIKLSEEELKKYNVLQKKNDEIYLNDKASLELHYMRDYIKEYGTFQQKKLAIAQEYDKKIAASGNEYDRKSLENQKQAAISAVDFEAMNKRIDWQGVFGNLTGMLESQLKETLAGLKEYVKTDQFKASSETDKKTVYDAIENLRKVIPGGQGTLDFNSIRQQMNDLAVALEQLQSAAIAEKQAYETLDKSQKKYDEALKTGNQSIIDIAKQNLDMANFVATLASNAYKELETNFQNLGNKLRETSTDTVDGLNLVADGFHNLASNSLPQLYKGLHNTITGLSKLNIGGKVGKAIGSFSEALTSAGVIGEIIAAVLSILDILKDGIGTLVANVIDTVLNAVDGILKDILSGDLVVKIGNSLKDGISNILNTISFGGFNRLSYAISGSNAKETAETISRLTSSNEALKVSVDALREEIAGTNGAKSIQAYNEAVNAQQRYNENLRQILDAQMGYHGSHHSNAHYWNLNSKSLNEVNKLLGISLNNSWNDFSKLTAEQMNEIRKHLPDVWSEMINQGKYGNRFKDDWNNYADQAGKVADMTESLRENIAQISFDSLRDSFVDALMDMDSDAKDFAGNFEKYMTKALLNFAIGDLLDDQMKKWYNSWADTINKQDGKLTDQQIAQYKKEWDAMVQMGLNKRDEIVNLTGYTGGKDSSYTQSSSKGGFSTASQDEIGELNGRFTAVQFNTANIDAKLDNVLALGIERNTILKTYSVQFQELRDIGLQSMYHLEDLVKYTKVLPGMATDIAKVKENTAKL